MNDIDRLSKQLWAIHKRHLRRKTAYRNALEADQKEANRIEQERHKTLLQLLVDVEDAVQMAVRSGSPQDDAYGTLKRVNRTRCIVVIGGREWDMPLELVAVSTASQRVAIGCRVLSRPADKVKQVVLPEAVVTAIENGALKRPILH